MKSQQNPPQPKKWSNQLEKYFQKLQSLQKEITDSDVSPAQRYRRSLNSLKNKILAKQVQQLKQMVQQGSRDFLIHILKLFRDQKHFLFRRSYSVVGLIEAIGGWKLEQVDLIYPILTRTNNQSFDTDCTKQIIETLGKIIMQIFKQFQTEQQQQASLLILASLQNMPRNFFKIQILTFVITAIKQLGLSEDYFKGKKYVGAVQQKIKPVVKHFKILFEEFVAQVKRVQHNNIQPTMSIAQFIQPEVQKKNLNRLSLLIMNLLKKIISALGYYDYEDQQLDAQVRAQNQIQQEEDSQEQIIYRGKMQEEIEETKRLERIQENAKAVGCSPIYIQVIQSITMPSFIENLFYLAKKVWLFKNEDQKSFVIQVFTCISQILIFRLSIFEKNHRKEFNRTIITNLIFFMETNQNEGFSMQENENQTLDNKLVDCTINLFQYNYAQLIKASIDRESLNYYFHWIRQTQIRSIKNNPVNSKVLTEVFYLSDSIFKNRQVIYLQGQQNQLDKINEFKETFFIPIMNEFMSRLWNSPQLFRFDDRQLEGYTSEILCFFKRTTHLTEKICTYFFQKLHEYAQQLKINQPFESVAFANLLLFLSGIIKYKYWFNQVVAQGKIRERLSLQEIDLLAQVIRDALQLAKDLHHNKRYLPQHKKGLPQNNNYQIKVYNDNYLDIAILFFSKSILESFGESIISESKVKISNRLHLVMNFGVQQAHQLFNKYKDWDTDRIPFTRLDLNQIYEDAMTKYLNLLLPYLESQHQNIRRFVQQILRNFFYRLKQNNSKQNFENLLLRCKIIIKNLFQKNTLGPAALKIIGSGMARLLTNGEISLQQITGPLKKQSAQKQFYYIIGILQARNDQDFVHEFWTQLSYQLQDQIFKKMLKLEDQMLEEPLENLWLLYQPIIFKGFRQEDIIKNTTQLFSANLKILMCQHKNKKVKLEIIKRVLEEDKKDIKAKLENINLRELFYEFLQTALRRLNQYTHQMLTNASYLDEELQRSIMGCFYAINKNLLGFVFQNVSAVILYDRAIEGQLDLLLVYIKMLQQFKIHPSDTRFTQALENIRLLYRPFNTNTMGMFCFSHYRPLLFRINNLELNSFQFQTNSLKEKLKQVFKKLFCLLKGYGFCFYKPIAEIIFEISQNFAQILQSAAPEALKQTYKEELSIILNNAKRCSSSKFVESFKQFAKKLWNSTLILL